MSGVINVSPWRTSNQFLGMMMSRGEKNNILTTEELDLVCMFVGLVWWHVFYHMVVLVYDYHGEKCFNIFIKPVQAAF
jgi:hypothetical protein